MHCIVGELCSTAADSGVWVFWYPYWPFQACLILSHYLCECTTKSIFFWISILWDIGIYLELSACVEWKNVIINGSLMTSVTMSMGKFRTASILFQWSYRCSCARCRLCFFIIKISNKQLNWGRESVHWHVHFIQQNPLIYHLPDFFNRL